MLFRSTGFYYMRLHGRNAAQWWHHAHRDDRYNYLYTADELREFSETARAASHIAGKAYLYTNNHFASKAVVNAIMLKAQLGIGPGFDDRGPLAAWVERRDGKATAAAAFSGTSRSSKTRSICIVRLLFQAGKPQTNTSIICWTGRVKEFRLRYRMTPTNRGVIR